jgi:hypothetical protein
MKLREVVLITSVVLLMSCQQAHKEAQQLDVAERTKDPRVVVQKAVTCTDVSEVCGRLYEEHGGACLALTESADFANRAAMRSCAESDFRNALAHLPPAADKLVATRGLAEAVLISRDNTSNRAAAVTELDALALQFRGLPGGAPYGAYYAASNDLNRVLTGTVPANQACATLKETQAQLPTGNVPKDLNTRLADLRTNLVVAMKNRSCV